MIDEFLWALKENPSSPYNGPDLCPICGEELELLPPADEGTYYCSECDVYFDEVMRRIRKEEDDG